MEYSLFRGKRGEGVASFRNKWKGVVSDLNLIRLSSHSSFCANIHCF